MRSYESDFVCDGLVKNMINMAVDLIKSWPARKGSRYSATVPKCKCAGGTGAAIIFSAGRNGTSRYNTRKSSSIANCRSLAPDATVKPRPSDCPRRPFKSSLF